MQQIEPDGPRDRRPRPAKAPATRPAEAARPGHLAARLNHLFAVVHPSRRGPYSNEEVAQAIRERGGDISRAYIAYLRKGERDNPTLQHLEALAAFFGVRAAYFFDEEVSHRIDAQLELRAALRDSDVQAIALRAAELSPKGLRAVADIIERVRDLEGLPERSDVAPGDRD